MTRYVHMFPEVFFMDVTCKLNRQKRDLFVMVVKDASEEAFLGNIIMVPSGKGWVFQKIYQKFFIGLYGKLTIGRNWLALTDDDISEHGPFDNCINMMDCYSRSRHILCVFHVLVMEYNTQVYPYLPHRGSTRNRKLTKKGKLYGKFSCCLLYSS